MQITSAVTSTAPEEAAWKEKERFFDCEYFATTCCVLKSVVKRTSPERWSDMHREPTRDNPLAINVRRKNARAPVLDPYSVTRSALQADNNDGVASSLSTRTDSDNSTASKAAIWNCDMFGRKIFNSKLARIAHILPAGRIEHEEWFGVAGAIVGLNEKSSVEQKLMALRGVKKKQETTTEEEVEKKPTRVHQSGYLHSVTNKLRLQGQGGVVDGSQPKMLIVPLMTLKEAKDWRGHHGSCSSWPATFRFTTRISHG